MDYQGKIKGEVRAKRKSKAKTAPKGASWAAQAKRSKVNKDYVGVPKALLPKITVTIKGKNPKKSSRKESSFIF